MPRIARKAPGGLVYHVLNRAAGRHTLFRQAGDYAAFLRSLADVQAGFPGVRVLAYCLMPNHWHLLLWPRRDGELARFMQRLTITHVRRWIEHRHRRGHGSVYQGRFKSFAVQSDEHLLTVARYIERNPLRANLTRRAQDWPWSSLGRLHAPPPPPPASDNDGSDDDGSDNDEAAPRIELAEWPVPRRRGWLAWVNTPQTAAEEQALERAIMSNRPFGSPGWTARTQQRLNIPAPGKRGRPRKANA